MISRAVDRHPRIVFMMGKTAADADLRSAGAAKFIVGMGLTAGQYQTCQQRNDQPRGLPRPRLTFHRGISLVEIMTD